MLGAQCTSHRRHNRSQMKNKIYIFGSFPRNFYPSVVKVKVPHPGIKLQIPCTYGRVFKRLCCSFSLMTRGKMLMELFLILLSCFREKSVGNPDARLLGTFEINYKMAASECSILTILRENRAL